MHRLLLAVAAAALVAACCVRRADALLAKAEREEVSQAALDDEVRPQTSQQQLEPCECGVFMSGQLNLTRGGRVARGGRGRAAPSGSPVLQYGSDEPMRPCGAPGYKLCVNRCLDVIVKHLPKAAPLICSSLERDCHRERAHLYVRNCADRWTATSLSAGKEFCCRDGEPVKCSH